MTYKEEILQTKAHMSDCERYYLDSSLTDAELVTKVKQALADEIGRKKIAQIEESLKLGIKITEKEFYNTKLYNR